MGNNIKETLIELLFKVLGIGLGAFILFNAFRFVIKTIMFLIKG